MAQAPAQPPKKTAPASQTATRTQTAPQVVTIVHRLSGLKMFRLLMRSQQAAQAVDSLDSAFKLRDDVHTNVIAGVAMDDGETIAAWLPEADIELGFFGFASTTQNRGFGAFEPPDVTVIGSQGKQLLAKYVGLDAVTGLSILKLTEKNAAAGGALQDEPVDVGESVRLFGPEPVSGQRGLLNSSLFVRIGATEARVNDVRRAPSGGVAKFNVSSPRLSQAIVGGVAINDAGETLGIVDGLEGGQATVLPVEAIRRAVQRVLEKQASVPKPWLGVRGAAVGDLKVEQISVHGWIPERAQALVYDHRGILVTAIIPDSPAAKAALRAGDVILKVNDHAVTNNDDFTWLLEQAGPSSQVSFTVARPDKLTEEALDVKLSGMLDPRWGFKFGNRRSRGPEFSLIDHGIETIVLKPPVASQLGTTAGLLVVYVDPSAPAFTAGLQPGDVIRSINGRVVSPLRRPLLSVIDEASTLRFEIVRNKQKHTITVAAPAKKKQ